MNSGKEVDFLHLQIDNVCAGLAARSVVEYFNRVTRTELDMKGLPDPNNRPPHGKNQSFPAVKTPNGITYQYDQRSPISHQRILIEHNLDLDLSWARYRVDLLGTCQAVNLEWQILRSALPHKLHLDKDKTGLIVDRRRILLPPQLCLTDFYSATQFKWMLHID